MWDYETAIKLFILGLLFIATKLSISIVGLVNKMAF